jgi:hypothetical protein
VAADSIWSLSPNGERERIEMVARTSTAMAKLL